MLRSWVRGSGALILVFTALPISESFAAGVGADLILTGGRIYAENGWAEAVAVQDGKVIAVGDAAEIAGLRNSATKVIDLAGAPVFPGFDDTHAHPVQAALASSGCQVPRDKWSGVVEAVRTCAAGMPAGGWIVAGPIEESIVAGADARTALDAAAPDNPVIVYIVGGHTTLVNSPVLAAVGIDRSTPDSPGAVIGRDGAGEPNGVLKEITAVWSALPAPDPATVTGPLAETLDLLLAAGVTSVTEANADPLAIRTYALLADQGRLKPRVRTCRAWEPPLPLEVISEAASVARERLDTGCVKIFIDGETYSGRTAALIEPYLQADGSPTDDRGTMRVPIDELTAAVTHFDRAGATVKFHAWGDAAVDGALTAVETARRINGTGGKRHEIGHTFLARRADLARAVSAEAVFEFSPSGWQPSAEPALGRELGAERMSRAWPVRDAIELGALAIGGSDWPSGPGGRYSLWLAIETLVTRLEPGATSGTPLAPSQRISLEQAIAMFTANPALASGEPDAPGIIAPGRKADLVVLDRNPFDVPLHEIGTIRPVMTIVGGEAVYRAVAE